MDPLTAPILEEMVMSRFDLVCASRTSEASGRGHGRKRSELAFSFTFIRLVLERPAGQNQVTEVHVTLVQSAHSVRLVVHVVSHILQVLQVRPADGAQASSYAALRTQTASAVHQTLQTYSGKSLATGSASGSGVFAQDDVQTAASDIVLISGEVSVFGCLRSVSLGLCGKSFSQPSVHLYGLLQILKTNQLQFTHTHINPHM